MLVPAIFERHAPDLTPHFSPTRRSVSEPDEQWYEVEAIIDHRYVESNLEYLVAWKPAHDGTAYEPSWELAAFANASLRRSYHQLASLPPIIETLIEKETRAALAELGTAITLKVLRQHIETKMGTSLLAWKAAIKAAASAYASEQANGKRR